MNENEVRDELEKTIQLLNRKIQKKSKKESGKAKDIYYLSLALRELVSVRAKVPY